MIRRNHGPSLPSNLPALADDGTVAVLVDHAVTVTWEL